MIKIEKIMRCALSLFAFVVFAAACSNGNRHATVATTETPISAPIQEDKPYERNAFFAANYSALKESFSNYYQNPIIFTELELPPYSKFAVVGGTRALFYPGAKLSGDKDLAKLKKPVLVTQGTILPIFSEIKNDDTDDGLFFHDDCYNYFYETEYEGKRGLVFGADLFGPGKNPDEVALAASLYALSGENNALFPYAGLQKLPAALKGQIEDLGLAYTKADYKSYLKEGDTGSLLLALYEAKARGIADGSDSTPLFITSDLLTDTFFTLYYSSRDSLKAVLMLPLLKQFISGSLAVFQKQEPKLDAVKKINNRVIRFLLVADALTSLLPQYNPEFDTYDNREVLRKTQKSRDEALASYPQEVKDDVTKILDAQEDWHSAVLNRYVDYSLFTDNRDTKLSEPDIYEKTITWLSLAFAETTTDTAAKDTAYLEEAAWILYMLAGIGDNPKLNVLLGDLCDAEAVFSETLDTGSPQETLTFLKTEKLVPLSSWISDSKKVRSALETISKKASRLLRKKPYSCADTRGLVLIAKEEPAVNTVLKAVSRPRLENRELLSGLDIIAAVTDIGVFGAPLYNQFPSLANAHNENRSLYAGKVDAAPSESSASRSDPLMLLTNMYKDFSGTAKQSDYAQTPGWFAKMMLSGLGIIARTEARDTVTVPLPTSTPPSAGISRATFRLNKLPAPEHSLEPAVAYYSGLRLIISNLSAFQKKHYPTGSGLLAEIRRKAFDRAEGIYTLYTELLDKLVSISRKELSDTPLTAEENLYLLELPKTLEALLVSLPDLSDYTGSASAVIVETSSPESSGITPMPAKKPLGVYLPSFHTVYRCKTDSGLSELYSAPGLPLVLYIPVQSSDGKRYIAAGFIYSYTEFTQNTGEFTKSEWESIILSSEAKPYELLWE